MQEYKIAINKNTNETRILLYVDNKLIGTELEENEEVVLANGYIGLLKPQWNGTEWIESATQEELNQAYSVVQATVSIEDRVTSLESVITKLMGVE